MRAPARGRLRRSRSTSTARMEQLTEFYKRDGIALGETPKVAAAERGELGGAIVLCPPSRDRRTSGRAAFPIPSPPSPPAGCGCAPAPASAASSCRSSSPTMPTGTISAAPSSTPAPARSGSPTARRTRWSTGARRRASRRRPLAPRSATATRARRRSRRRRPPRAAEPRVVNRFAALLDRLVYEPRRNAKLRLIDRLFPHHARSRPRLGAGRDDRRAVFTRRQARPDPRPRRGARSIRCCSACPTTMSATSPRPSALIWPPAESTRTPGSGRRPTLADGASTALRRATERERCRRSARALARRARRDRPLGAPQADHRRAAHRRLGAARQDARSPSSAASSPTRSRSLAWARAALSSALFAWVEGRAPRPEASDPAPFRPPMLSHPLEEEDFDKLDPADFVAEWKWDGIRLQAVGGRRRTGGSSAALFAHRRGRLPRLPGPRRGPRLRGRARRRTADRCARAGCRASTCCSSASTARASRRSSLADYPGASARLRPSRRGRGGSARRCRSPSAARASKRFVARLDDPRIDLSPLIPFATWDELAAARADPASVGAGEDAEAIEGCMLKRADSPYRAGPPEGPVVQMEARPLPRRRRADVRAARPRQALVVLFGLHLRGLARRRRTARSWCRSARPISASPTRSCCKLDRYVRNHTVEPLRPGPRGRVWPRPGPRAGGRLRGPAALDAGTSPASPCASRASTASAGTSRPPRPTASRRWRRSLPAARPEIHPLKGQAS